MEALILKFGPQLPALLARAAAGDPFAIAALAALGVSAVAVSVKGSNKN